MNTTYKADKQWKTVIRPKESPFSFKWKQLWAYRDLCLMLVRKNYAIKYKQTILSPLYYILGPLMTSGVFSLIFGTVVGVSTDGCPQFLFFMAGNLIWGLFSDCFGRNADIFVSNAYIFGKVYFPRMIIPISIVLSKFIGFAMDMGIFIVVYFIFVFTGSDIRPGWWILYLPVVILQISILGAGCGLIISSLTIKYRDLIFVVNFALKILMYISPVIFPVSSLEGWLRDIALLNPIAPLIEIFRYGFFGLGTVSVPHLLLSTVITVIVFFIGLILFNIVEKDFVDTV